MRGEGGGWSLRNLLGFNPFLNIKKKSGGICPKAFKHGTTSRYQTIIRSDYFSTFFHLVEYLGEILGEYLGEYLG